MMAFCPEHQHQNPKFTPLSETTSIPTPFICGVTPPRVLEQPTPIATQPVNAALSPHSSPLGLNGEEHAP